MTIEVTMTATRRPELLMRTLTSFRDRMFRDVMADCRLFLNVDPVGEDVNSWEIVRRCEDFFKEVVARCPTTPHFPTAFKWCWSLTNAPFVFNLEEDWELFMDVDLECLLGLFQQTPELLILRLPFSPCTAESNKSWNHFLPWNGSFYEVPEDKKGLLGFSGNPSMLRREFVERGLKMLDGRGNPEKQLKWRAGHDLMRYRYGVYGFPGTPAAVRDIGRDWKAKNGWRKVDNEGKDNKAFFTHWEKVAHEA